jgi:hypothetical protein
MSTPKITTLEKLHEYLRAAMQLEHATIPPYLIALYSIHPLTNSDATHVLRVIAVEEMLHLTLAANILNAVGGKPDLTVPGFVPLYPAYLPDGETDFEVSLQRFSKDSLQNFLQIERPGKAPNEASRVLPRERPGKAPGEASRGTSQRRTGGTILCAVPGEPGMHFYSIGEFYEEIVRGLRYLREKLGSKMFTGDPSRQITSEFYYSSGGKLFAVTDLESAVAAANLILEQGEGFGGGIYNDAHELAHYYRFEQLGLGKYYQAGDKPGAPSGPPVEVDWDATYPIKKNARLSDYPDGSELRAAAVAFNQVYAGILALITAAYNGKPQLLMEAVPEMFRLRNRMTQLINNPIPGMDGVNAAPTFEVTGAAAGGTP